MSKVDTFLSRSSHIAQIVLVAVAVFGYFSTVRPAYQKEVLAEEIAQKQLRLNELHKSIATLRAKQFAFAVGAECTGLLDPPQELALLDKGSAPEYAVSSYTLGSMKACAKRKFRDSSLFGQLEKSQYRRIGSIFNDFLASEELANRVSSSESPEQDFRNLLLKIDWSRDS